MIEDKSIGIKYNASNIVISEEKQSETQTPIRDPLKASMFETMNSIVSRDEFNETSRVLNQLSEYHSQYNRFEDVMNFKKKLTKKDLFTFDHRINPRLNQIHQKLKHPLGHALLMEKS